MAFCLVDWLAPLAQCPYFTGVIKDEDTYPGIRRGGGGGGLAVICTLTPMTIKPHDGSVESHYY